MKHSTRAERSAFLDSAGKRRLVPPGVEGNFDDFQLSVPQWGEQC